MQADNCSKSCELLYRQNPNLSSYCEIDEILRSFIASPAFDSRRCTVRRFSSKPSCRSQARSGQTTLID
jgi:hypothetical protein